MSNSKQTVKAEVLEEVIKYLERLVLPDRHRITELFEKREQAYATPNQIKN